MKFWYEKGVPLLFSIAVALQEIEWMGLQFSPAVPVVTGLFVMLLLFLSEKKQWNVLGAVCIVAGILVFLFYYKEIVPFEMYHLFVGIFALQYFGMSALMGFVYVKFGCSLSFIAAVIVLRFYKVEIQPFLLMFLLFFAITSCSEFVHVSYYKSKLDSRRTLGMLPVFLVMLLVCMLLPVKDTPFDWSFLTDPVTSAYQSVRALCEDVSDSIRGEGSLFSYESAGIGNEDESTLGGTLEQSDRVLLKVKGNRSIGHAVYLNGSISDTYTGAGWKKDAVKESTKECEYKLAAQEIAYAMNTLNYSTIEDEIVMQERTLDLKFGRMRTKTLFYPEYLNTLSFTSKGADINDDTVNILFKRARKRNYEYRVLYKDVNLYSHYVTDYLKTLDGFEYPAGELRDYAENIKEKYTKLPDSLPEQVVELAKQVTKDEQNDYERMKAICGYLKTLNYSKDVDDVPENTDFVEHFLFDTRKGYCTYFATAAAVLGRSAGIPTRYVEGLTVPKDCEQEDGYYLVDGTCAHAWCEAYFEGFGWVIFDATPGYGEEGESVWTKKEFTFHYKEEPVKQPVTPLVTTDVAEEEDTVKNSRFEFWLLCVVAVFAVVILVVLVRVYRYGKRKQTQEEQCRFAFGVLLFYCRKLGFTLGASETLMEFSYRVQIGLEQFDLDPALLEGASLEEASEVYLKLRYGACVAEEEDLKKIMKVVESLQKIYRKKYGKVRYWMVHIESYLLRGVV